MLTFLDEAIEDMRTGRDSWRVYTVLSGAALAIAAAILSW
jgi:hypothetical protein